MVVPLAAAHILPQGSGAAVKKRKELQRGNIVEEYKLGNTTIRIDDFYFRNNTAEQNDAIIQNFYATGMRIARSIYAANPECEIFQKATS